MALRMSRGGLFLQPEVKLRAPISCPLLLVCWLGAGCRGTVRSDTRLPDGTPMRAQASGATSSATVPSSSEKPAAASSSMRTVETTTVRSGSIHEAPPVSRSSSADPAARRSVEDFPDCPENTGRVTGQNQDGETIVSCAQNGARTKLHGPSWRWSAPTHLIEAETYQGGLKHGSVKRWYADGRPSAEGEFALGERQGTWREYHRNGALAEEAHYEQGQLQGLRRRFFESGRPSLEATYESGAATGTWRTFYDSVTPQVALTVSMNGGREEGPLTGYFPDGSPWPADPTHAACAAFETCSFPAQQLDFEALPPVHCPHETPHAVPLDRWAPLLKAARAAWSSRDFKVPRGCVEAIKLSCAPDLDGVGGGDVLAEISYRIRSPDCAFARKHDILQSRALLALSPLVGDPGSWRTLGFIDYLELDDPDAESPYPKSFAGFMRFPDGGIGLRICLSGRAEDCRRNDNSENLMMLVRGEFSTIGRRSNLE